MQFQEEIFVERILPSIRKIIASRLHKQYGHNQEEIARELKVTQPAVSQYLKGRRGEKEVIEALREDPQIDLLLDEATSKAAKNQEFKDEISDMIQNIRSKGMIEDFTNTQPVL